MPKEPNADWKDGPFGGTDIDCGSEKMGEAIIANIPRTDPHWNAARIRDFEVIQTAYHHARKTLAAKTQIQTAGNHQLEGFGNSRTRILDSSSGLRIRRRFIKRSPRRNRTTATAIRLSGITIANKSAKSSANQTANSKRKEAKKRAPTNSGNASPVERTSIKILGWHPSLSPSPSPKKIASAAALGRM